MYVIKLTVGEYKVIYRRGSVFDTEGEEMREWLAVDKEELVTKRRVV